ncbi:MAG: energy-coupling factor ABC transporter ATP-binding protein, partial [Clostridiales bacterium]|nr:energy-coupling factor ABC transporter ATP-binding protein [Clostridiales bacterium]
MGLNGSGKSTLLSLLSHNRKPISGKIKILGKEIEKYRSGELYKECLINVPQDPTWVFSKETVEEELKGCSKGEEMISYDLKKLYSHHPYDISGGEKQLVVLAKALSHNPKVLLLDEPTKGLDFESKAVICRVLKELASKGIAILIVTHDVELACRVSDRCGLLFNGTIGSEDIPEKFFAGNYYSTSIAKATCGIYENIVRTEDLVKICNMNGRK